MTQVKEEVAITKPVFRKQLIRIMPFLNPSFINMGLTEEKMVVMDGVKHKESLTYIEVNKGVRRYLSGLNELDPEVQRIADPQAKDAAIKAIRTKIRYIESTLGANDVPENDPDFLSKIKLLHPLNYAFWDTIEVSMGNEPEFLDPEDANHLIIISGIEAGGFSTIAKSYEDARMSAKPPKWFLDKHNDTASSKVEVKKIKNLAASILNTLFEKDQKKLFYLVKNVNISNSWQYKNSTSVDVIYDYLDEHITGRGFQSSAKKAAEEFIKVSKLSLDDLKINAVIYDANFYRIIYPKADGILYYAKEDVRLGRNAAEVLQYLKESLNSKIWDAIRGEVEAHWRD